MSDFLSNLAARSLGRAELIQPRLTSLFGPPRAAGRRAFGQSFRPNAFEQAETSDETTSQAAPSARQVESRIRETQPTAADLKLPVAKADPEPADLLVKSNSRRRQPSRQRSPSPTPTAIPSGKMETELFPDFIPSPRKRAPASQVSPPVLSAFTAKPSAAAPAACIANEPTEAQPKSLPVDPQPKPRQPERSTSVLVSRSLQALQAEQSVGKPPRQSALGPLRQSPLAGLDQTESDLLQRNLEQQRQPAFKPPSPRAGDQEPATPEERRLPAPVRPESLRSQVPHSEKAGKVVVEPDVTHYPNETTLTPAEAMARPEPTSIIQVTIGRIEVRATPPAAKPLSEKRSGPLVMSLDEYLRRRSKAGGR